MFQDIGIGMDCGKGPPKVDEPVRGVDKCDDTETKGF